MTKPGPLSLNTATVKEQWSLQQCIEGCARHGITGISPWRDKLADYTTAKAAKHIREVGLTVTGLCRGGMFPAADAAGRKAAIEDNKRAIEPLHPMYAADRACVNTVAQALDICDALGSGPNDRHLGVAVDVYHVWWDPNLAAQIKRANKRVLAFHICDWLVPTADLLLDRGMMGDGVIDIRSIRAMVEGVGYDGFCEVEIMSANNWWKKDADAVLRTCIERHATVV